MATAHIMHLTGKTISARWLSVSCNQPVARSDHPGATCPCWLDSFVHRSSTHGGEQDPLIQIPKDDAAVDRTTPVLGAKGGLGGSTIGAQGLAA